MPLSWTDRCDLAIRYAPRLVLFPEQRNLLPPGAALISTQGGGDYHPRGIEPLLERRECHTVRFRPH